LLSQERVCRRGAESGRIEVVVLDSALEALPGIEVIVSWEGGADSFFTGFQPDQGLGYADFDMSAGVSYSVTLADGSPTVGGLRLENCTALSGGQPGGWRLTFQNSRLPTATPDGD
jgi:hypothetical protein